jgi:hypothetical protein
MPRAIKSRVRTHYNFDWSCICPGYRAQHLRRRIRYVAVFWAALTLANNLARIRLVAQPANVKVSTKIAMSFSADVMDLDNSQSVKLKEMYSANESTNASVRPVRVVESAQAARSNRG